MEHTSIKTWVELKKQTPVFEQIVNLKRRQRNATYWNHMSLFFREADKHLK